jgi:hypothetical protein
LSNTFDNIAKFVSSMVRPLVTFGLTAALIFFASTGLVEADEVVVLTAMAVGYWFGQRNSSSSGEAD